MKMRALMTLVESLTEKETVKWSMTPDVPMNPKKRATRMIRPGDGDIERLRDAVSYFNHHRDKLDFDQIKEIINVITDLKDIVTRNQRRN
jgi:hypothetical protein